ncbi:MAG: ThuA domain-containing protein [Ignavibacteriota bacterium]
MRNPGRFIALLLLCAAVVPAAEPKILVYTRNYTPDGKGYVHDNIAASVTAIRKMGAANGFAVDSSDDPSVFTNANLKQYSALVFSNSNNEAFTNDAQREAFKAYIHGGGGFVGLHSASGSERSWDYYQQVVGAKFKRHPKLQPFTVRVVDSKFQLRRITGDVRVGRRVLLRGKTPARNPPGADDRSEDAGGSAIRHRSRRPDQRHAAARLVPEFRWRQGVLLIARHKIADYEGPILTKLILGGIQWAIGARK